MCWMDVLFDNSFGKRYTKRYSKDIPNISKSNICLIHSHDYACICIDLYHTSIAMCLCSFIWFARALFLNAECFVFPQSVLQDAKGSCHCHHDIIQGTVSSGNLSSPNNTQNEPNFWGSAFSFKSVYFNGHFKHGKARFVSPVVLLHMWWLWVIFVPRFAMDPQICVWSHPQHHVVEAMLVFSSIQRMTWRRFKNHAKWVSTGAGRVLSGSNSHDH